MFTERGLEATLDDVARHAGVGVGTVYRRFPDKEELIEALFMDRLDAIAAIADEALASTRTPGRPGVLPGAHGRDPGERPRPAADAHVRHLRPGPGRARQARMQPLVNQLVERAQAAGQLRADIRPTDIVFIVFMLTSATQLSPPATRHLAPVPDADPRWHAARSGGATPLPVPTMPPDEMETSMRQAAPWHR